MEPEQKPNQEAKSFFTQDKQRYSFYFDIYPQAMPEKVDIYIQAHILLEDVLPVAIDQVNQQLVNKNMALDKDIKMYKVRLAGKNFKPKTDMPAMSMFQKICDLKVQSFAVQILNRQKAILSLNQIEDKSQTAKIEKAPEQPLPTAQLQKLKVEEKISQEDPKKN